MKPDEDFSLPILCCENEFREIILKDFYSKLKRFIKMLKELLRNI